jgi:glucose/arabinose dehydrogenase
MHRPKRYLSALGAVVLLVGILPFTAANVLADSGATVPDGFKDEALLTGLNHPMAIVYAPNGNVFVAEKRGTVQFYTNSSDTTPTLTADLTTNVHNYWDRGLMGLAVDPGYPAAGHNYIYVLYAYNHILGDPAPAPRWPASSGGDDQCPDPPNSTKDGCVISGRLSRIAVNSTTGVGGSEDPLITDWCQQFPSHSLGSLMFGPEGALYASAGEGASFILPDYGQLGGTNPDTTNPVIPENPCGDPGGSNPAPPNAEGGALRAQDLRTSGDPVGLDGAVIRVDPATGAAWPDNANIGASDPNARRIIAYGLRNPYRFTIKPGTNDLWIGDVGFSTWEELDTLSNPDAAPRDYGWPCYEGNSPLAFYQGLGLNICNNLSADDVTLPYFTYNHGSAVASGDGCTTARGSSTSGLAFLSSSSGYPNSYDGALFMTDYSRRCIWVFPADGSGDPDIGSRALFANLDRAGSDPDGGAVFLTTAPNGDLVYADYDRGEIRRIHYYGANVPPNASFTASPSAGPAPLGPVTFDANGSTDANFDTLTYAWDLDGDGQYDDATGVTASRTYMTPGDVQVGLKVTDPLAAFDTTTRTVSVGNSPPIATIDTPSPTLTFKVGDVISFSGSETDLQEGTSLPASAYVWTLQIRHCPSDCHTHIVQTFTGVKSGTFVAPDHEYPSHLQLLLTVTDSGGLTSNKMVELFPQFSTVAANTSPAGLPITVGPNTGAPPPAVTGIVNSEVSVAAPATTLVGESIWSFQHWSDNGARTHAVTIGTTPKAVTATYALTGSIDRSNTCSGSPAAVAPSGAWTSGNFSHTSDADWYRFKLTKTTTVRLILGNLQVPGKMELFKGCSTLLKTSDRGGNGTEEIIRSLAAGSYAVRLTGSGTTATPNYALRIKTVSTGVHVLTSRTRIDAGVLRLVGEVYNNSSKSVGPVFVTAKLYNASNHLLATRKVRTTLSYIASHGRSPFLISGSVPAGFNHWTYGVSAPVTSKWVGAPTVTVSSSGLNGSGHWAIAGSVKNAYSTSVNSLRLGITLYDSLGNVLDVARASVGRTTLSHGSSTTYSATFTPTGLVPDRAYLRGMIFR